MPFFDLSPEQLVKYDPAEQAPADFDAFWSDTLAASNKHAINATFTPIKDAIYDLVDAFDVTFAGYAGQPVKGWFIAPKHASKPLPTLVTYIGYGGGRSLPVDHLVPAMSGFAHFVMDTRGQGSTWSPGDTADDPGDAGNLTGPQFPGVMTRGIESPQSYYYRRVFTDAARAIQAAITHPSVDKSRVGVTGVSQGGGITLAAAALAGDAVKIAMADVPFLCHYSRATTIIDTAPYNEIAKYLATHRHKIEQTYKTLAYFDGMHFAPRIKARCLLSVGLMDTICPPSTIYAAYNRIRAPKEIRSYTFNNHEGGGAYQVVERMKFAKAHL